MRSVQESLPMTRWKFVQVLLLFVGSVVAMIGIGYCVDWMFFAETRLYGTGGVAAAIFAFIVGMGMMRMIRTIETSTRWNFVPCLVSVPIIYIGIGYGVDWMFFAETRLYGTSIGVGAGVGFVVGIIFECIRRRKIL